MIYLVPMPETRVIDLAALAEREGWTITTARTLHKRAQRRRREDVIRPGDLPVPDGHAGRAPWWYETTIIGWEEQRPGQGIGGGRPPKSEEAGPAATPQ
jgi:hypothetical protein